jgi:hypothetical protein
MDPTAKARQADIEPFAELAALREDVCAETLVAKLNEEAVFLEYLFKIGREGEPTQST